VEVSQAHDLGARTAINDVGFDSDARYWATLEITDPKLHELSRLTRSIPGGHFDSWATRGIRKWPFLDEGF
jgi:hypothetical protein